MIVTQVLQILVCMCMATIVGVVNMRNLRTEMYHRNQPNKTKIALNKP